MKRVIVFGGYGVFGSHVVRELAARGVPVTIAGRDLGRAEAMAQSLGPDHRAISADVTQPESCCAVLAGHGVAINSAGPFNQLGATLLDACLEMGCHYVDITDDRGYAATVREHDGRFRDRGLAAVYGCSSLPGISGALALHAKGNASAPVNRVRVTLFIGNRNPKGQAAVASFVAGINRPIIAPQGTLRGFRDGEVVPLPLPFGARKVFNFESPDYDLLPDLLQTKSVSVKLGFELRLATRTFALLARVGLNYGSRAARIFSVPGRLFGSFGCSGGAVQVELFLADGSVRRAAISGAADGQRMAALPCPVVAHSLAVEDMPRHIGASTAYEFLGADALIAALVAAGFQLRSE